MLPETPSIHESFHALGLRAELGSTGVRCWLEVEVVPDHSPKANAVQVEVLLQPRDSHGLPYGPACVQHEAVWPLEPAGRPHASRTAFGWLPRGVTPAASRQYHFRVTPVTIPADDPRPAELHP